MRARRAALPALLAALPAAAAAQQPAVLETIVVEAERQFELWTGQRPPAGLFDAAQQGAGEHTQRA